MKLLNINDMKGGWFVGNFEPTAFKTKSVEVSYKIHPKGQKWDKHYHKIATEINYLVKGRMSICSTDLDEGSIFVIEPEEIADPVFHEDCHIVCVKVPGELNDKYIV